MDNSIFQDTLKQKQLEDVGYAQIPSFLSKSKVKELRDYLLSLDTKKDDVSSFSIYNDRDDPKFNEDFYQHITRAVSPELESHFTNIKTIYTNCALKKPNPDGYVAPHQDSSCVDEPEQFACTLWIPLSDVDIENGALGIIDGSQHFFEFQRPSPAPYYRPPLLPYADIIWSYAKPIPMKAGDAFIFDSRSVHCSFPNSSSQIRWAVVLGICSANLQTYHYYKLPNESENLLEKIEIDHSFFYENNNRTMSAQYEKGTKPVGWKSAGIEAFKTPTLSDEIIESLILSVATNTKHPDTLKALEKKLGIEAVNEKIPEELTIDEPDNVWKDPRGFFEMYTPSNILAEIRWRWQKRRL